MKLIMQRMLSQKRLLNKKMLQWKGVKLDKMAEQEKDVNWAMIPIVDMKKEEKYLFDLFIVLMKVDQKGIKKYQVMQKILNWKKFASERDTSIKVVELDKEAKQKSHWSCACSWKK